MIALITFLLFLFIGALICNGWYEVTRRGRVFGAWQKFWEYYSIDPPEHRPVYRFSRWIREPISECIICYSSIYGSTIFWGTFSIFNSAEIFSHSWSQLIAIWIAYCLALVPINYIIHKQLN